MPAAIPYITTAVASALGLEGTALLAVQFVSALVVADYQRSRANKQASRRAAAAARDRTITIRSGVAPRKIVLGTVRLSGPLMYAEFVGARKEYLDTIVALTGHRLASVDAVIFDDDYVAASDITGQAPQVGKYSLAQAKGVRKVDQPAINGSSISVTYPPRSAAETAVTIMGQDGSAWAATVLSVVGTTINLSSSYVGTALVVYTTTATLTPPMRVQWMLGTDDQASTTWSGVSTPAWTADHRLRGVSHVRTLAQIENEVFATGSPNVSVVGTGPYGVFDPRNSSTLPSSSNPALLAAWFRTLPVADGGMGVPSAWIDWPSVAAAANVCDELITVRKLDNSGYEQVKRYECHTVLSLDQPPVANLQVILDSMAGEFPFTAGTYRCYAGAFRSATITITDDDVAAGAQLAFAPGGSSGEMPPNIVTARFFDRARNYVEAGAKQVVNTGYVTQDGGEEPVELDLVATVDERQANYLMGVHLERARPSLAGTVVVTGKGADVALLDTLQFNLQGYEAISGRTFEVRRRTNHWNGTYTLEVTEVRAATYALDADRFTPATPVTPPDTSDVWLVAVPPGLAIAALTPAVQSDGTRLNRARLTWGAHPQSMVRDAGRIEMRWRSVGGDWIFGTPVAGDATEAIVQPLAAGTAVVVEARAVNGVGNVSEWVGVTYLVQGKVGDYVAVQGLAASGGSGTARISWTAVADKEYSYTELRIGASWASATFHARAVGSVYPWTVVGAGTYDLLAKHVDRSGNESAAAAAIQVTVDAAGSVSWASISGRPTTLAELNATDGSKLGGIAAGATVGATAGVDLKNSAGTVVGDAAVLNQHTTWTQVAANIVAGLPQNNATVGATAGVDLKNNAGAVVGDTAVLNQHTTWTQVKGNAAPGTPQDSANLLNVNAAAGGNPGEVPLYYDYNATTKEARLRGLFPGHGMDLSLDANGVAIKVGALSSELAHVYLPSDLTFTTTTLANASGMAFDLEANTRYEVQALVIYQSTSTSGGLNLSGTVPAGATIEHWVEGMTSTTAMTARKGGTALTNAGAANTNFQAVYRATIVTAGTAGKFQLTCARGGTAGNIVLKANTSMTLSKRWDPAPAATITLQDPGFAASYSCSSTEQYTAIAGIRITYKPDGTWSMVAMYPDTSISGTPVTGNWGTPTTGGAGANYEMQFQEGGSGGSFTKNNGASAWVALSQNRVFEIYAQATGGQNLSGFIVLVPVVRLKGTTTPTSQDSLTLNVQAISLG